MRPGPHHQPFRSSRIAALALALALPAASAAALSESEPNDLPAQADPVAAGVLSAAYPPAGAGALVDATLAPGDVDQFTLDLVAGELVTVAVLTPDGGAFADPAIRLYAPGGAVAATDDDSGPGFLPALRLRASASGAWRVAVSGFGDDDFDGAGHGESFSYRLVVSVVAAPPLFVEPLPDTNGSSANADPLPQTGASFTAGAPGGVAVVTGAVSPGDVDFYAVPVRPGDALAAFVWDEDGGAFDDPTLRLLSGPGPSARDDDDEGPGFLPAILAVAPAGPTTAALAVSGFRDAGFTGAIHGESFTYHLVVAEPPFFDADGDGVADAVDNCPNQANPSQSDVGGVGAGSVGDGIGDACQCGDVSGDGVVTIGDVAIYQRSLLLPPTATIAKPELCNVGGNAACTISDVAILQRALLWPPKATIQAACAASLPH